MVDISIPKAGIRAHDGALLLLRREAERGVQSVENRMYREPLSCLPGYRCENKVS